MEKSEVSNDQTPCCSLSESIDAEPMASEFSPYVVQEGELCHIDLHVEGVHCAKCIGTIESNLQKQPAITQCRVNMSTARLSITWQGEPALADTYAKRVDELGYKVFALQPQGGESRDEASQLMRYMAIAGFAMGNIMLISVALWSSDAQVMGLATRGMLHWVSATIALPTLVYSGRPFFLSAMAALKARRTNMDVPISLALILAAAMSLHETIVGGEHAYFDSAVMLLFFLLIGRWLDAKARGKARAHAIELLSLLQGTATIEKDGHKKRVMISELSAGDTIIIAVGEQVPTDAKIVAGSSEIDTAIVTGESTPRIFQVGDMIYGGTLNLSAPLTCEVIQSSKDSLLANVVRLMEQAEQGRAKYTRLADKAARLYTPVVHTLAVAAFCGWYFVGGMAWQPALLIAITTLIITCPCAMGLAVPAVQVLAVEWLMKRGILVKAGDALEKLNSITMVIFDKTGTLTQGKPKLDNLMDEQYLKIASSLADYSQHPLSRAISEAYDGNRSQVQHLSEIVGVGVKGVIDGKTYQLAKTDQADQDIMNPSVSLLCNKQRIATFQFTDAIREKALETVTAFNDLGIKTILLSGDHQPIADAIARKLSINEAYGAMLPDQKLELLKAFQENGETCLMVGDGLNDAPALAQANVSISPSTGMDITQNTADMVFRGTSLSSVYASYICARFSTKLVKQNFLLAALYNCCAIPLAVMGYVTPLVAAVAMSFSSLIVIGNSFRIRLQKDS
jgi:Cu2+-exporting ATPase